MEPGKKNATARGSIELAGVTKRFGETVAVRNIDLKIPAGAYCCLLGPSGCGKTTILRMIAGHEQPTEGAVLIDGQNVVGAPPVERGTAMMFQSYALFPHLSCLDNVAFNLKVRGVGKAERHERAGEMLARVRMKQFADRLPAQLSGGQQQRIALARALITNPARAAARRAALGAGRVPAPADARRAAPHPERVRHQLHPRDAHADGGHRAGGHGGGHGPGADRAGRFGPRGVRPAAHPVRRTVHRGTERAVRHRDREAAAERSRSTAVASASSSARPILPRPSGRPSRSRFAGTGSVCAGAAPARRG